YFLSIASNRDVNVPVHNITDFVIKVEYHENGPLFSELNYKSQKDTMNNWKKFKRLEFLGIPIYWGSGLTESNGIRLMVMDWLGIDLQIVFMENGGELKKPTVLQLGLDVLEYIHDNEYIHADIKAANLLLQGESVYLADYGLLDRYCPNGDHKEYKENPKKGHNGTIEYTSIDVHKEVAPSRRGDLEVLGYCLLHWQCGTLPWLSSLRNPADVQEAKAKLMSNLPDSVLNMSTYGTSTEIARYLSSVKNLGYNEKPEYQTLRKILSVAGSQGPLDLSRPRLLETGRPTTQRVRLLKKNNNKKNKNARSKPVVMAEEDDEKELGRSTSKKVWSKPKREMHKQRPNKADMAAKGRVRQRPMPYESDEDVSDEDEPLPPRGHPRTRAGARQRQELDQSKTSSRGRQNGHYENQQTHTLTLNDNHAEVSSEQWEETDDEGDHWGSDVCGQQDEWTQYHYRGGDGFGKSENHAKWPIKRRMIFLVVMILAVVGITPMPCDSYSE
uniref:non-specific serine/threonine protein kinase n=1 Tax=Cyprinus carpio TaxID=7962 RepID=A0A8C1ZQ20_CYPCA